jgi:hypothetical protein
MVDHMKRAEFFRTGWQFKASGQCKVEGCNALVEYWQRGKEITIRDFIGMSPHWTTCRGTTKKKLGGRKEKQLEMFPEKGGGR